MEQTTQQINQKQPLPIKTKVAVLWIKIISTIGIIIFILFLSTFFLALIKSECTAAYFFILPLLGIPSFLIFFLGLFISKKKKWAWWFAIIILFIGLFLTSLFTFFHVRACIRGGFPIVSGYVILPFLFLLPFILLLLDRKNFFMIAS